MDFQIYNTLTRQKEKFVPLTPGKVDFYACGPTVYNVVHIGNLRAFLFADTLFRWLKYGLEYKVRWVMNITDVDDKTIRDSATAYPELAPLERLKKFTREYEAKFFEDLQKLNIPHESFFATPRATDSIAPMQDLIRRIHENGIAYEKDGSLYFSIERYNEKHHYGELVNLDLSSLKSGTRTLADEIEKENVQDFVLWKARKEDEPFWDFELNGKNYPGRPGWHIECSAMEYAAFGHLPFDIHSGGVDLCFPHHEDEIAQSTAGYGSSPTKYWVHNEHLLVDGQKMSKSLGNFYTLGDLEAKGFAPEVLRFFLVTNHYRTKLNLSFAALEAAKNALERIRNFAHGLQKHEDTETNPPTKSHFTSEFSTAMNDDLNTPQALAVIFEMMETAQKSPEAALELLKFTERIFGVRLMPGEMQVPPEVLQLAAERQQAKADKDFDRADVLRKEIGAHGFQVRDTPQGFEILPLNL